MRRGIDCSSNGKLPAEREGRAPRNGRFLRGEQLKTTGGAAVSAPNPLKGAPLEFQSGSKKDRCFSVGIINQAGCCLLQQPKTANFVFIFGIKLGFFINF